MLVLASLLAAGCDDAHDQKARADQRAANPAKYDSDSTTCRAQVDGYMRNRRAADDSRAGVFAGDRDRYGQGALPSQMEAYSDSRSTDSVMNDCMAARGWDEPHRTGFLSKIGQPHTF
jgi:hypothetical protein